MIPFPAWRRLAWGLLACGGLLPSAHAGGPQHDLFKRPEAPALKQRASETVKTLEAATPPAEWKPELRAIIRGGESAWVNVEGRIVRIGQEIDGYRLLEVEERRAVFVKNDVRYALDLRDVKAGAAPAGNRLLKASDVLSGSAAPRDQPPVQSDPGKGRDRRGE